MGSNGSGGFQYQKFYQSIVRTIEHWPEGERTGLLEWWDQYVILISFNMILTNPNSAVFPDKMFYDDHDDESGIHEDRTSLSWLMRRQCDQQIAAQEIQAGLGST